MHPTSLAVTPAAYAPVAPALTLAGDTGGVRRRRALQRCGTEKRGWAEDSTLSALLAQPVILMIRVVGLTSHVAGTSIALSAVQVHLQGYTRHPVPSRWWFLRSSGSALSQMSGSGGMASLIRLAMAHEDTGGPHDPGIPWDHCVYACALASWISVEATCTCCSPTTPRVRAADRCGHESLRVRDQLRPRSSGYCATILEQQACIYGGLLPTEIHLKTGIMCISECLDRRKVRAIVRSAMLIW